MLTLMKSFVMTLLMTTMIMIIAMSMGKKTLIKKKDQLLNVDLILMKKLDNLSPFIFLITLMFLIFDAEITLIMPFIPSLNSNLMPWSMTFMMFSLILLLSTYYEWMQGILNWN